MITWVGGFAKGGGEHFIFTASSNRPVPRIFLASISVIFEALVSQIAHETLTDCGGNSKGYEVNAGCSHPDVE